MIRLIVVYHKPMETVYRKVKADVLVPKSRIMYHKTFYYFEVYVGGKKVDEISVGYIVRITMRL